MKLFRYLPAVFLISILLVSGCGDKNLKQDSSTITPNASVIAVFKNFENAEDGEIKLIFRRLDNLEYIMFKTDLTRLTSAGYPLVSIQDQIVAVNNDYLNLKFEIAYSADSTGNAGTESANNRLYSIKRVPGDRFSIAKIDNDTEADDFLITLKKNIRQHDADQISRMISYPITVIIKKKKVIISKPELLIINFDQIFNQKVTDAVLNQIPADVKASRKGLIIGNGEVRINIVDGKILITAINNS